MPNDNQVAIYSSVRHYLEAVARAGTDDALTVAKVMREMPIHDIFTENGTVRADGRVLYDRYLMRVKSPAQIEIPLGLPGSRRKDTRRKSVPSAGNSTGGCTLGG